MPRPTSNSRARHARDACHGLLAAALLYLRSHLAGLSSTASDAGPVTGLTVQLQSGISPAAIASWDVLAQTTLLGLVLFRMGGLLLGSGPKAAALYHGRHGELGVKDLERFAGASAAGIWGTRHFILLLQLSSQKTLKTSAYELAVLRASGLVAVVLFVLTVINIVWADVDDPCATAASESAAEPTKASSLDAGLSYLVEPSVFADEVLPQANPIFRWVILAGSGLTTAGIAAVTFVDNHYLATPFLVSTICSLSVVVCSRWLSTPQLSVSLVASILAWFFPARWYLLVSPLGPDSHRACLLLSSLAHLVTAGLFAWLASLAFSLGAQHISDETVLACRLRISARRLHDVALNALLRAAPVVHLHDGRTESPPDSAV